MTLPTPNEFIDSFGPCFSAALCAEDPQSVWVVTLHHGRALAWRDGRPVGAFQLDAAVLAMEGPQQSVLAQSVSKMLLSVLPSSSLHTSDPSIMETFLESPPDENSTLI